MLDGYCSLLRVKSELCVITCFVETKKAKDYLQETQSRMFK